jgi:hypothetical protein|tara:strand:+ start:91 stop:591 length:501 start_codon:yes stop_codon:yes gene_type:complete
MIETNQHTDASVESQPTPQTITTTMILNDLDNGVDRKGIQTKYSLEGWELTEMFKHPVLKGKKAKKKRKMSFNFVDDTAVDSAQITVQEVINDVMGTESTIAGDFHDRADLRTQDAIENTEGLTDTYTGGQKEQMEGQAWEEEIQGRTEMDAQDQLNEINNEEEEF